MTNTVILIEPDLTVVIVPDKEVVLVEPNAPGPSGPRGFKGDNAVADIAFAFQGNLLDGEELVGYAIAHGLTLSQASSVAKCVTAPSVNVVLEITKNGSSIGTVTFLAGQTTGSIALTSTVLVAGDVVAFIGPTPADLNFASVTVTLAGLLP